MNKIAGLETHPAAALFPLLEAEELAALAEDIRTRGLIHAITLHEGKILDGRNRALACERAGVPIRTEIWTGTGSPTAWVVSQNLHRRHLTASQRAMVAADMKKMFEVEAKERQGRAGLPRNVPANVQERGEAVEKAAKLMNVSPRAVYQGLKVVREAPPEVVEAVKAGKVAVSAAAKDARPTEDAVPFALRKRRPPSRAARRLPSHIPREARESIPAFANFLRTRLPSTDRLRLGRLLVGPGAAA